MGTGINRLVKARRRTGPVLERSAEHAAASRRPFSPQSRPMPMRSPSTPTLDRQSGRHLQSRSPQTADLPSTQLRHYRPPEQPIVDGLAARSSGRLAGVLLRPVALGRRDPTQRDVSANGTSMPKSGGPAFAQSPSPHPPTSLAAGGVPSSPPSASRHRSHGGVAARSSPRVPTPPPVTPSRGLRVGVPWDDDRPPSDGRPHEQ